MPLRRTEAPRQSRPRIALGVLDSRLGYFVRRLQLWVFQDFIRRLAPIDISPAQFSVLVVISANRGLSQAQVARTLGIERAGLARLLHGLESRNLVQRLLSPTDGRRHVLKLTRDGQTVLSRAKTLAAQHEAALKRKFGSTSYQFLLAAMREVRSRGQ